MLLLSYLNLNHSIRSQLQITLTSTLYGGYKLHWHKQIKSQSPKLNLFEAKEMDDILWTMKKKNEAPQLNNTNAI
jgi:hypothetical protein